MALTEPTPENVLGILPLLGGRTDIAVEEVLRLLSTYLPGVIAAFNTAYGTALMQPKSYRVAPSELEDVDTDSVLVDVRTDMKPFAGGQFQDTTELMVHSVDERLVQGRTPLDAMVRAKLVVGTLYFGLAGWFNPAGVQTWFSLVPVSITMLPAEWSKYNGRTVTYRLDQVGNASWAT